MVRHRTRKGPAPPAASKVACALTYISAAEAERMTRALWIVRPDGPWSPERKAMSESEFAAEVRRRAARAGVELRWHSEISDDSIAGWPDEVFIGRDGEVCRELKAYGGTVTAAQRDFVFGIAYANRARCDCPTSRDRPAAAAVWWPCHLDDDTIDSDLDRIAGRRGSRAGRGPIEYRPPVGGAFAGIVRECGCRIGQVHTCGAETVNPWDRAIAG